MVALESMFRVVVKSLHNDRCSWRIITHTFPADVRGVTVTVLWNIYVVVGT
jgi:hypothetical protein